jgi:H+-translocating NAD(P) transhydrogenase subunit beta
MVIGAIVWYAGAYFVKMTAMPEMVALFNGFGGLASLLVGWANTTSTGHDSELDRHHPGCRCSSAA